MLGDAVHAEVLEVGDCRLQPDRKSTRLNSSHLGISYAVFCLKKKKITKKNLTAARVLLCRVSISRSRRAVGGWCAEICPTCFSPMAHPSGPTETMLSRRVNVP